MQSEISGREDNQPPLPKPIRVEHLRDPHKVTGALAHAALRLLASSYAAQYEEPNGSLPKGIFAEHFNCNDDKKVRQQKDRMSKHMKKHGSQYWYIQAHKHDNPLDWHGLVKTSPSKPDNLQKRNLRPANCYLNDIVVHPAYQNKGYASALLLIALTSGSYYLDGRLSLDAFKDNQIATAWFARLGLEAARSEVEPFAITDNTSGASYELPMVSYTSEGRPDVKLEHIIRHLEATPVVATRGIILAEGKHQTLYSPRYNPAG